VTSIRFAKTVADPMDLETTGHSRFLRTFGSGSLPAPARCTSLPGELAVTDRGA
jgi:hypothetical protein